jgi:taurine-pyruvate aminotransferase
MFSQNGSEQTMGTHSAADIVEFDKTRVWHHLTQHQPLEFADPLVIVEGKGMRVTDIKGNEYLDAVSGGVWTVNVGYGRERIAKAVYEQLNKMCYFANSAGSVPGALFAQSLIEKMPGMERVYYSNSGSEANEKAYKMVRQLAHLKTKGDKHKIVFRNRDYHGTTIAALSSSGQSERKDQYGPMVPGFVEFPHCCCYRCPFGKEYGSCNIECAHALEDTILGEGPDSVGAVVLEPITAGGGIIPPVPEYFPIIQSICKKYDVLLHMDEVVCGMGRTGTWFGYQHYDVQPDIVTMAKGVASGYAAISCTVTTGALFEEFKAETSDRLHYFRDISTFGGCTGGPAAAIECTRIIEQEHLLQNARDMGAYLADGLNGLKDKHELVGDVRGKGLLAGMELVKNRRSREPVDESLLMRIAAECMAQGVIIGRTNRSFREYNNTIALSPALITTRSDLDEIVGALDVAIARVAKTAFE